MRDLVSLNVAFTDLRPTTQTAPQGVEAAAVGGQLVFARLQGPAGDLGTREGTQCERKRGDEKQDRQRHASSFGRAVACRPYEKLAGFVSFPW